MTKGWATLAIGLLALVAILAGLAMTGGPGQARKERRDRERALDLSALSSLVSCLARENGNRLPDRLETTPQCDRNPRLTDPFTGTPYRYAVTGQRHYRLCAEFELPENRPSGLSERDPDGCISHEFVPVRPDPPAGGATIPWRE